MSARRPSARSSTRSRSPRATRSPRCSSRGCKATLRRAYEHVPHYRAAFDAAGVHPDDLRELDDLAQVPVHRPRTTCGGTIRSACSRCRARRWRGSTPRRARPASRRWSATPRPTSRSGPRSARARSAPRAGGRAIIVHVAYGYGLFTGGLGAHYGAERLGCTVVPMSGGMTERQVQLIADFGPDIIMVTPSYMLAIGDEFAAPGARPARLLARGSGSSAPSPGPRRCAPRSSSASRSTRSTSTACRR